ncbi:MAG: MoaD/ThiS family protein [Chloroflexi bacterium]|nr:MoaD/ThiS family protein [Chloroflexota bacterium]
MNVIVHLGEPFWRAAGQREIALALGDGATVSDALRAVGQRHPALAGELDGGEVTPMVFVNDEEARTDRRLTDGAKIYVVWPVSGG